MMVYLRIIDPKLPNRFFRGFVQNGPRYPGGGLEPLKSINWHATTLDNRFLGVFEIKVKFVFIVLCYLGKKISFNY